MRAASDRGYTVGTLTGRHTHWKAVSCPRTYDGQLSRAIQQSKTVEQPWQQTIDSEVTLAADN